MRTGKGMGYERAQKFEMNERSFCLEIGWEFDIQSNELAMYGDSIANFAFQVLFP